MIWYTHALWKDFPIPSSTINSFLKTALWDFYRPKYSISVMIRILNIMELINRTQEIVIILENQSIRNLDLSNNVKNHTVAILLSRN